MALAAGLPRNHFIMNGCKLGILQAKNTRILAPHRGQYNFSPSLSPVHHFLTISLNSPTFLLPSRFHPHPSVLTLIASDLMFSYCQMAHAAKLPPEKAAVKRTGLNREDHGAGDRLASSGTTGLGSLESILLTGFLFDLNCLQQRNKLIPKKKLKTINYYLTDIRDTNCKLLDIIACL